MNSQNTDLAFLSASELAAEMGAGRLSPVAVMDRFLDRIQRYDEKLHAFVTVYADEAREAADAAGKAIRTGHAVGPFHGVPIALKDIIDLEGRITTGGSKVWEHRVSATTASLARRLIQAGMIVIGKTHTVEFAMGGWGTNEHMGTAWNPWDLATHRAPGGSSAGSGVSVAAGMAPWAIGTDTGGSVRLPASWCGLAGLKATIGRISTHGVLPLSTTLDTPGPMCRTVEDAARLYQVLAGPDPLDPKTMLHPIEDPMPSLRRGVVGLRLAAMHASEREKVAADILAAYDESVALLSRLGAEVVEVAMPKSFDDLGAVTGRIIGSEGYYFVGDLVDDMDLPLDPAVRPRIWLGKDVSARDYQRALAEQQALVAEFRAALEGFDGWLSPTTTTSAPPLDEIDQSATPAVFTRAANLLEMCAATVPNGFTADGLPSALQIACAGLDEATALRIAWAHEDATKWTGRVPPGLEA